MSEQFWLILWSILSFIFAEIMFFNNVSKQDLRDGSWSGLKFISIMIGACAGLGLTGVIWACNHLIDQFGATDFFKFIGWLSLGIGIIFLYFWLNYIIAKKAKGVKR